MTFSESLNEYMKQLRCTNKTLSAVSGVSAETISRYRRGTRIPSENNEQIAKIAHGLAVLCPEQGVELSEEEILKNLIKASNDGITVEYETYISNLKRLLETLEVSNSRLAKSLNFDPSYISKILSGNRRPADLHKFTVQISGFVARQVHFFNQQTLLSEIIGCSPNDISYEENCAETISQWLGSNMPANNTDYINQFLVNLDEFNLSQYIQAINFDKIKIITSPFLLSSSKKYTGLKEMMASEIDFIRITVLSRSKEDVIIYSNMPMQEMSKDKEFPKKWMFGTAMMLKKGLHLHMIHNVDRPLYEMMLGLESYIPMYMTGQISPYYLKNNDDKIFLNHIKVSGAAALSGEALVGHHKDGRYYLTTNKEDLKYYRKRAEQLLQKAHPLMQIYNHDKKEEFWEYFNESFTYNKIRKIFSSLPVFTISDKLLAQMISENNVSKSDYQKIKEFIQYYKAKMDSFLQNGTIVLELPEISPKEFERKPLLMAFSELFYENDIKYTYDEYLLHMRQTKEYAKKYKNCHIKINPCPSFRNIDITIIEKKVVMVSKSKSPAIHFLIKHPKMIEAFEKFIIPLSD